MKKRANSGWRTEGTDTLGELLSLANAEVRFGLEAQGHIPTVERMLEEHATWDQIGAAIGWHGPTVADYYARHYARPTIANLRERIAHLEKQRDELQAANTREVTLRRREEWAAERLAHDHWALAIARAEATTLFPMPEDAAP